MTSEAISQLVNTTPIAGDLLPIAREVLSVWENFSINVQTLALMITGTQTSILATVSPFSPLFGFATDTQQLLFYNGIDWVISA